MFVKMRAASLAALAGAVLLSAGPALAGEEPLVSTAKPTGDVRSMAVSYRDLDLVSDAGVDRLESRVRSAAKTVCDTRGLKPLPEEMASDRCYDGAMERAGRDIEIAVAKARSGEQVASRETGRIAVSAQ